MIRNDYWGNFECEHCGHIIYNKKGYNDRNYDVNVIPNAICPNCGKSSSGETEEEQQKRLNRVYKI